MKVKSENVYLYILMICLDKYVIHIYKFIWVRYTKCHCNLSQTLENVCAINFLHQNYYSATQLHVTIMQSSRKRFSQITEARQTD